MHKIYSRPRIRLPKFFVQARSEMENRKIKKLSKIVVVLIIAFTTVKICIDSVSPIFDSLCEHEAKSLATIISNEQATNVMKEHKYEELFSIEKDTNGNITMIKSNIIPINEIISDVANKIQIELNKKGREDIEIALRKFYRI